MKKQALGRGLNALISTEEVKTYGSSDLNEIDIDLIETNPNQPRTEFDEDKLVGFYQSQRSDCPHNTQKDRRCPLPDYCGRTPLPSLQNGGSYQDTCIHTCR